MIWIHVGAFHTGSGNSRKSGPDYIIDEGVVMVSLNYRLGIFGDMSTGDSNSPGNYGMKDMVLALKWIKANIEKFCGDPENITIFVGSAGGMAVHYLLLLQNARGLFTRAISQSGSALNPWAYQSNPAALAHQLGRDLNLTWIDNSDLRYEYSMYNTDLMFVHGIDQTARIHAKYRSEPVYYYQFSFVGAFNLMKMILLLHKYSGAVHGDNNLYLLHHSLISTLPLPVPKSKLTRSRMVRMWTNFAKNGDPTAINDDVATTKWSRVSDNQECLHINATVTSERYPHHDRMAFWNHLQNTYAQKQWRN